MLPRRNPEVLFKPVTDGAVLLHVTDEVYFGLNAVGARVWEHLPPASTTFEELCEKIQAEYSDAGIEEIRTDRAKAHSGVHLVLERHVELTDDAIINELRGGRFDIHMNGVSLSQMGAIPRTLRRGRIYAMDVAHGVNKRMANAGIRLPHGIKRLLRRSMEGA
jgi:hypothetical protein